MAVVLESLTVPRASALPSASLAQVAGSSAARRSYVRFSEFRGLKLQTARSSVSMSFRSRPHRRGGRIVCEARKQLLKSVLYGHANNCSEGVVRGVPAVTDSSWQSLVLKSDSPVLVEFWAPWCGPCRMIHPVIDRLAKQYAGKLKCYKVNTDESPSIASQYGIRSIPTVLIFKNGEKRDAVIGAVPESTLTTCIEKFL
ncbi:UNVERIFIED_CONTAM: Thioredoxin M4, chloroplastic [Sesamum angustifolium]|uniref:Thioredoxin M4, chloroplastic n=1 Tax=Sesamum angustifolium TaxID=2727405 RepID=A0AAW2PG19_9LAMI